MSGPAAGPARRGATFWVSMIVGWVVIGYGLRGVVQHHIDTRPRDLATFAAGGALLHDLIFAPLVIVIGTVVARLVPPRIRGVIQAAMIISGCLMLFSYPAVRGYAHVLHNPTSLPHNYTANLAIVLGIVWLIAAAASARRLLRPQRSTG